MTDGLNTEERVLLEVTPYDVETLYDLWSTYPDGVDVVLTEGRFELERVVRLPSGTTLSGEGAGRTVLVLQPHADCHVITNADMADGNECITLRGFSVEGNGALQNRPKGTQSMTFACGVYLRRARSVLIEACDFSDIRQTAAHFSVCSGVVVRAVSCDGAGWSGISTTHSSHVWIECDVANAGRDVMHSAIHIDGGVGIHVDARVRDTTGNGIMLDSTHAPLISAVVKGSATRCRRGISLTGSPPVELSGVYIEGDFSGNREAGIMVSNSRGVVVARSRIADNGGNGLLFQGVVGGCDVMVVDCEVTGNAAGDYEASQSSAGNWIFCDPREADARGAWAINGRRFPVAHRETARWREG